MSAHLPIYKVQVTNVDSSLNVLCNLVFAIILTKRHTEFGICISDKFGLQTLGIFHLAFGLTQCMFYLFLYCRANADYMFYDVS